ncbi:MAG: carbohydrate-binding domain-containing protein [Lachnospiraceae bacterium]|nr:carbohydrate-binding domain-containing protein [Lachnospiraceae bacterium]
MRKAKKLLAKLMVFALIMAYIPAPANSVSAASSKVSTKMYTISKKAGTYTSAFKITITAKKGYKVYYSTGSSLNIKKVIKSGKKKTIKISKTTTLKVYGVKKSTAITKKKLKTSAVKKKTKSYKYTIKTSDDTATADTTVTDTTAATTTQAPSSETASSETTPGASGNGDNNPPAPPNGNNPGSESSEAKSSEAVQSDINEVSSKADEAGTTEAAAGSDSSYNGNDITFTPIALGSLDSLVNESEASYTSDDGSYTYKPATTTDGVTTPGSLTFNKLSADDTEYNYELSGTLDNIEIKFNSKIASDITLKLNNATINNSAITSNEPVIQFSKKAASATLVLAGANTITGPYEFDHGYDSDDNEPNEPSPLIKYANANGTLLVTGDSSSSLTLTDSMNSSAVTYKSKASADATELTYEVDPVDGISTKGTLVIDTEGTITIDVNGNALNAKAEANMNTDDESFTDYTSGGVTISNGTVNLTSKLSKGINSKYGLITIAGGTTNITAADDAVKAKSYNVQVTGGTLNVNSCGGDGIRAGNTALIAAGTTKIDKCYGDGIQAENIEITGGKLDIVTYYEYAATNFYSSSNWSGKTNSITESNSTKTETINYDTGSHKALKAGTKEKTYSYTRITDADTGLTAGTQYTQPASGGLVITGGTITLDTRNTGIKYNGGSSSGGSSGPGGNGGGDSKSIIGAPDDAIHSNNTATISGGDITIYSSDDGITAASELNILNSAKINIATAYEGIEGGTIVIGKASSSTSEPDVTVYSNDDGINASAKTNVTYKYADENEETYKKTSTSGSNNTLTVTAGTVTVEIADDQSHSVTLAGTKEDGTGSQTYTFSADGDGIDCNGSFYAYGGTIVTVGGTSNGNGVFDRDGSFVIGEGVTIFGIGTNGMVEGPTEVSQAYIEYGNNGSGSMGPKNGGGSSSSSISSGTTLTIADSSGNTLYTYTTKKSASYVLFSSPKLTSGSSYTLKSGSTTLGTLTATTAASSEGSGAPPEMPGGNDNGGFNSH